MSIQRTLQTGLLAAQTIQTMALRQQVAQMQQLALEQQEKQNELARWRQMVFSARKMLDEAERVLESDPIGAFYSISIAQLHLQRINESIFPEFHEKEVLYQVQRRAGDMLAHAQASMPHDAAQQIYRLAWLDEVRIGIVNLMVWQQILEKASQSAFLFTPAPGFARGVLIFIGGNILCVFASAIASVISTPFGIVVYFSINGITLNILDVIIRGKIIKECHSIAQKVGGWVGKAFTLKTGRSLVDQARNHLAAWSYPCTTVSSRETKQTLGAIQQEIDGYRQLYFS